MAKKKKRKTEKRQSTIYFPVDVIKRAKIYGITVDRELSEIVAQAVSEYWDKMGAPPAPDDDD